MGWSGGTFTRVHDWTTDEGSAIDIEADRMDAEDDNFAAGINACIHKGGTNTPTANLPMGGYRHTGVDDAVALTDYASAADVIDQHLVYYTASGSSSAYTITPNPAISAYAAGQKFCFKANHTNNAAPSLNVNALGAKNIMDASGSALAANTIENGLFYEVVYTGVQFQIVSPLGGTSLESIIHATNTDSRTSTTTVSTHAYMSPFALTANRFYLLEGFLKGQANASGGYRFFLDFSQTPRSYGGFSVQSVDSSSNFAGSSTTTSPEAVEIAFVTAGTYAGIHLAGAFLSNASTGGTLAFQFAQSVSNGGATSISAGSWLRIRNLGPVGI
jgi:hypothetical protein